MFKLYRCYDFLIANRSVITFVLYSFYSIFPCIICMDASMFPSLMHSFSLGFHIYYLCSSLAPIVGFVICDSKPICILKIFTFLYMINHLPHFDIYGLIA